MDNLNGVTITSDTLSALLRMRDGRAALYFLHLSAGGDASAAALGWSKTEAEAARALLAAAGILPSKNEVPLPNELPRYTADDLSHAYENEPAFAELVRYAQQRMGAILKPSDLERLLGVYEALELPAGVIMLLISWCAGRAERKEQGAPVRMFAIEREAYRWKNAGIDNEETAEKHIRRLEEQEGEAVRLLRLLQIHGRSPSKTERDYLEKWAALGLDDETIYTAYDKTVVNTGKLSWSYMNKILEDWALKGKPEEGDAKPKPAGAPDSDNIRQAYERSRSRRKKEET